MAGETLYPAGAQLLEGAASSAQAMGQQKVEREKIASGENMQSQKNMIDTVNAHLDRQANLVQITPQLALGLVKNTGEKDWLASVGTSMRADVLLGLYSHGLAMAQAKRSPKITQTYDANGKIRHSVVYTDEEGNIQVLPIDAGFTPEKLHPGKPGGKGGGSIPIEFRTKEAFKKSYEGWLKTVNDPIKFKELESTNADAAAQMRQKVKDYGDRYDAIIKEEAGSGSAQPSGNSGGGDSGPALDKDALFKDL